MNSSFVNELYAKNPIFQKITTHLENNRDIKELSLPEMKTITSAPIKDVHELLMAINAKAGIGRYIIGRKGNPNRFVFDHYPEDVIGATVDKVHSADPIPKAPRGRPGKPPTIRNDAGNVVMVTDTRERHLNVSMDEKGLHIDMSQGMNLPADALKAIVDALMSTRH